MALIDVKSIYESISSFTKPFRKTNWKVVLFCLITASVFWFFNALNKTYTTRINYPVKFDVNRDSLVFVQYPPSSVPLNVTGGGWQLLKRTLSAKSAPVYIELEKPLNTKFFTAANLLPIFANQLIEMNINYVAVDTIFFSLETYLSKRLKIIIDTTSINLRPNHFITSVILLEPDSVSFRGPNSMIRTLPEVFVINIPDKNLGGRYNVDLSLDLFTSSMIKKEPEAIHVSFDVEEFIDLSATLPVQPVNFPSDSSVYLMLNEVSANYKLQRSFRNKLKVQDLFLVADFESLNPVDSTVVVEILDIPSSIKDFTFTPTTVKVAYVH